jgi:large subunit ribosomal protein L21
MYAIIEVGAKQYKVEKGDIITVEKLEIEDDKEIALDNVLMVSDKDKIEFGKPYIIGAKVLAKVLGQTKGKKAISYKYRRRKSSDWTKGHRQKLTRLEINKIVA